MILSDFIRLVRDTVVVFPEAAHYKFEIEGLENWEVTELNVDRDNETIIVFLSEPEHDYDPPDED
mgnify:CR=1 FL=1